MQTTINIGGDVVECRFEADQTKTYLFDMEAYLFGENDLENGGVAKIKINNKTVLGMIRDHLEKIEVAKLPY